MANRIILLLVSSLVGCNALDRSGTDCAEQLGGCPEGFECVRGSEGGTSCVPMDDRDALDGYLSSDSVLPVSDAEIESDAQVNEADLGLGTDAFEIADQDEDGISDTDDNCPAVPNRDQVDGDRDGVGDVCDGEPDRGNFRLGGQMLLFGGDGVDQFNSLRSQGPFGAHSGRSRNYLLKGTLGQ